MSSATYTGPSSQSSRYYNARMEELLSDSEETPLPGPLFFRGVLGSTLLGFGTAALVQPFEVGKTLLQVQWVPKSAADAEVLSDEPDTEFEGGDHLTEEDDDDEENDEPEDYFTDLNARPAAPKLGSPRKRTHARDASGYLMRRSVFDENTKPEYTLPVVVTNGVWDMMRSIMKWPGEGYWSMWKGQLTAFVTDSLGSMLQPFLLAILNSTFASPASLPSLPLVHSPHPAVPLCIHVASHLLTGLALSPLELIRTRLVVQSRQKAYRRYEGPVDALYKIIAEEGGWRGVYLNSNLVIPAVLDHLFRPLLHLAAPLVLERLVGVSPAESPAVYAMGEFALGIAALLVTLPIETVRKRLQVQYRGTSRRLKLRTCVETRPQPYFGVVDAIYRIVSEETAYLPKSLTRKAKLQRARSYSSGASAPDKAQEMQTSSWSWWGGLQQLYRGFGMASAAHGVVLLLTLAGGKESAVGGWAEV